MGLLRPSECGISTKFFENPEIIANFDPVRTWLTRNHKKYTQSEPPTNKSLAGLCYQLLMFQEHHWGKSVSHFLYFIINLFGRILLQSCLLDCFLISNLVVPYATYSLFA